MDGHCKAFGCNASDLVGKTVLAHGDAPIAHQGENARRHRDQAEAVWMMPRGDKERTIMAHVSFPAARPLLPPRTDLHRFPVTSVTPPTHAQPPSFAAFEFRSALGMFATGVTIVTARTADGELVGLTANSFNSVSLNPPLVLWSLSRLAGSMAAFSTGSHYAINVLAADQKALAERFATRREDRWNGVEFTDGTAGAPLLSGAAASFECFNRSRYEEGDHVIFVGQVEHCSTRTGATPLLFHGGQFYTETLL